MGILEGKVALITGAGQGVGQGIAYALASEGARIAVVGRTQSKLETTCAEIDRRGGAAEAFQCDVAIKAEVERCVAQVAERFGSIDILVNNAQQVPLGRILDISDESFQMGIDSGPLATLRFMRACHPYLKAQGGGAVVNLATSAAVRQDPTGLGAYTAAKEAIRALSRAAACEWGAERIRVNCIMPLASSPAMSQWTANFPEESHALTSTVPLGHIGDCEKDVGRAVVFLCGPDSVYITGHTLPVDGGQALLR